MASPQCLISRSMPPGFETMRSTCCSTKYGGDQYTYHGETDKGIKNDAKTLHIVASNFFGGVHILN